MQDKSELYENILALSNHWFESTVVIGESGNLITERGETILFGGQAIVVSRTAPESGFMESQIVEMSTCIHMFDKEPTVGGVVSQEIDLTMVQQPGNFPAMSVIMPYVRATVDAETYSRQYGSLPESRNIDGDVVSEWIQQGVFYIDSREVSENDDGSATYVNAFPTLKIHGYDAMMKTEQDYGNSTMAWPALDVDIVIEVAGKIGVRVDPRTFEIMTDGYTLPALTSYSLREALSMIAAKYLGCFIISDVGELRLVSLLGLPEETNLLIDHNGNYITFGIDDETGEPVRILV